MMARRQLWNWVSVIAIVLVGTATSWALDLRGPVPEGDVEVLLDVIVEERLNPATEFAFIDLAPFNDGTGRMAVSTIQGTIRVIDGGGNILPSPLVTQDQAALVLEPRNPPNEAGMTGIAFHPDFNNPGTFGYGKLYGITTELRTAAGGLPLSQVDYPFDDHSFQILVREWDLAAFGDVPGNAGNNSYIGTAVNSRELLRVAQPGPFHTLADLAFNTNAAPDDPDYGMLYITSGDGGNTSGRSNTDRAMSAQNPGTIYGNILRINPDPTAHSLVRTSANTGQPAYSIPSDNPYAGDDAMETKSSSTLAEVWANGVRSPWRLTFDRGNGDLYLADVGENAWEEVNVVERGNNHGWGQMEGNVDSPFIAGDGTTVPGLTRPIIALPADTVANSIIGGFVYRGSAIPDLVGKYVFADLGQGFESSALFYAIVDPDDPDGEVGDIFEFKLSPLSPKFELPLMQDMPERIFSIGEDANGELYLIAGPDPRQQFTRARPSLVIRLAPIPEPSAILLAATGLLMVWGAVRCGRVRPTLMRQ